MDINMNNATFYKGENGDKWIYLSLDGGTTNGIKVFYDDGNFKSAKNEDMATYYEGYLQDVVGLNHVDMYDNLASDIDFWTTLGLSAKEAKEYEGKSFLTQSKYKY